MPCQAILSKASFFTAWRDERLFLHISHVNQSLLVNSLSNMLTSASRPSPPILLSASVARNFILASASSGFTKRTFCLPSVMLKDLRGTRQPLRSALTPESVTHCHWNPATGASCVQKRTGMRDCCELHIVTEIHPDTVVCPDRALCNTLSLEFIKMHVIRPEAYWDKTARGVTTLKGSVTKFLFGIAINVPFCGHLPICGGCEQVPALRDNFRLIL